MRENFIFKNFLMIVCIMFVFVACANKNKVEEYNKPALYWYNKILEDIAQKDLDAADDIYTSLESEHRNSPLIPTSLLILANAHIDNESYELANFYLDEYIKRFTLSKNIDYVRFLKIKANYLGFKYQLRDQELIDQTIQKVVEFKKANRGSPYMPLVDTINARLFLAKANLNKEIASLYRRTGKKEAAKFYENKIEESWVDQKEIVEPKVPFYRSIFE